MKDENIWEILVQDEKACSLVLASLISSDCLLSVEDCEENIKHLDYFTEELKTANIDKDKKDYIENYLKDAYDIVKRDMKFFKDRDLMVDWISKVNIENSNKSYKIEKNYTTLVISTDSKKMIFYLNDWKHILLNYNPESISVILNNDPTIIKFKTSDHLLDWFILSWNETDQKYKLDITKDLFIEGIKKVLIYKPKELRDGQFIFNYLDNFGVSRKIQFEKNIDCFYDDSKIDAFLEEAFKLLIENENRTEN